MRTWVSGIVVLFVVGACSSTSDPTGGARSSTTTPAATGVRPCAFTPERPPEVVPVDGSESELTMTSFDGTEIRLHWYPIAEEAPVVLMGPGWSAAGAREESEGTGLFGDTPISALHDEGYHVLTWDPRGFGESTGTVTIDAPDHEARDVRRMLDWLAVQDPVRTDAPGDPRAGMVGGSYGGGIQFATAGTDCRVDAIVPTIAWNSLGTSLYKADTVKIGWSRLLYTAASGRDLDEHITSAFESGTSSGVISAEDAEWFRDRGPGPIGLLEKVSAPTLIIQGTVDTLFTLDEAASNYTALHEVGTPVALLWYCGGHGVCLTDPGDAGATERATVRWLRRWLQGDRSVETGPAVEVIDQLGDRFRAPDWPVRTGAPFVGSGRGELELVADGGSGPADLAAASGSPVDGIASSITPAPAERAVEVVVTADRAGTSIGAPELRLRYTGTSPAGEKPTRVFAQLVDDETGIVLGTQVTPIAVDLDGEEHEVEVPMEMIGHTFATGDSVTLQLVASTVAYAPPRFGGSVEFTAIRIALPVASGLTPVR